MASERVGQSQRREHYREPPGHSGWQILCIPISSYAHQISSPGTPKAAQAGGSAGSVSPSPVALAATALGANEEAKQPQQQPLLQVTQTAQVDSSGTLSPIILPRGLQEHQSSVFNADNGSSPSLAGLAELVSQGQTFMGGTTAAGSAALALPADLVPQEQQVLSPEKRKPAKGIEPVCGWQNAPLTQAELEELTAWLPRWIEDSDVLVRGLDCDVADIDAEN